MILWAIRDKEWHLAECYSFKIKDNLNNWYVCELEGFADATAARKFKHYILESNQETIILTDNRPCFLAWSLMKKGKLSASLRLNVFFANLSSLPVKIELN